VALAVCLIITNDFDKIRDAWKKVGTSVCVLVIVIVCLACLSILINNTALNNTTSNNNQQLTNFTTPSQLGMDFSFTAEFYATLDVTADEGEEGGEETEEGGEEGETRTIDMSKVIDTEATVTDVVE
jgi:hypothetical protein